MLHGYLHSKLRISHILFVLIFFITACAKSVSPNIVFSETEFDFGVIKQSGGKMSHDFWFTYEGKEPLVIVSTPTSCRCTAASVAKNVLQPGERAKLTVVFDPNFHEEPEGKFYKTINLITKPEIKPFPEVKMWAEINLDLGPEAFELKGHHDDDE